MEGLFLKKEIIFGVLGIAAGGILGSVLSQPDEMKPIQALEKSRSKEVEAENAKLKKKLAFAESQNKKMSREIGELRTEINQLNQKIIDLGMSAAKAELEKKSVIQESNTTDIQPSSNTIAAEPEEIKQDQNTEEQYTGLVAGIKNLERVDPNKINRQVESLMKEHLAELELEPDVLENIETYLINYYREQNELSYMVLDPNVPADTILQKIQDIYHKTMNDLGQVVQYDDAKKLIASNKSIQIEKLTSQFLDKYNRYKFEEAREEDIKSVVGQYINDHPYLSFTVRNRMTPNFSINTSYDDIQLQREYIGDIDSLSGLMKKSIKTKKDAQLELFNQLNLGLAEEDQKAFFKSLDSEVDRSQRGVKFFERIENEPEMAEAWIKLSSGMRDGNKRRGAR